MSWINSPSPKLKNFIFTVIAISIPLGLLVGSELWFAVYRPLQSTLDPELGWTLKKNFSRVFNNKNLDGTPYKADFSTNELGLRTYGSIESAKVKILVVGDSFTGEPTAGDKDMWYSVAADKLELDTSSGKGSIFVWAGGSGGYGTYQQLLLLRRILKSIRPDVFFLQFCINDFGNNHREMEDYGNVRQQKYRRPYLDVDGESRFSAYVFSPLWRTPIIGDSRYFNVIDSRLQTLQNEYFKWRPPSPPEPALQEKLDAESIKITATLLSAMRKEVQGMPAYMVNCEGQLEGLNKHWIELGKGAGFIPLSKPTDSILSNRSREVVYGIDGGHFNERGNRLFGEALAEELANQSPFASLFPQGAQ